MADKLKILFLGTPDFAVKILGEMKSGGLTPTLIITAPDKPKGRKLVLTPTPVKVWANEEKIPVLQPLNLCDVYDKLKKENWDIFVLAAFGKIVPKEFIALPKHGILNIHPSILPEHRGSSPVQSAILYGDKKLGVTIMLLDEELDHGPIVTTKLLSLTNNMNQGELEGKLAKLGGEALVEIVPLWVEGRIKATPQYHKKATYTKKIKKEDALINWSENPETIERKIRAFYPWPGAYFFLRRDEKPFRVIITKASLSGDKLKIEKVKPEGKREMMFQDFLNGNSELKAQIPDYII